MVKTGDCLGVVSDVLVVPCSEEHVYEVYGEFSLPEGDHPGGRGHRCLDLFTDFVGLPYDESALVMTHVHPAEDLSADGHRVIQCLIGDPAGPVTGSLKGAAR